MTPHSYFMAAQTQEALKFLGIDPGHYLVIWEKARENLSALPHGGVHFLTDKDIDDALQRMAASRYGDNLYRLADITSAAVNGAFSDPASGMIQRFPDRFKSFDRIDIRNGKQLVTQIAAMQELEQEDLPLSPHRFIREAAVVSAVCAAMPGFHARANLIRLFTDAGADTGAIRKILEIIDTTSEAATAMGNYAQGRKLGKPEVK